MFLEVASLNSGSNGNCYYIGNKEEAILIDIGLSCKELEIRLARLNLYTSKIKAVFISHEHTDHIKGIKTFSKKHKIPVYFTFATLANTNLQLENINYFDAENPIRVGSLRITAFEKHHDAAHPHSFIIEDNDLCIGVFTDLGIVCNNLVRYFKMCDAAFLESNYCEEMLRNSRYPYFLKRRISGGKGHLSNTQALELFQNHQTPKLQLLLLSHLSRENNSPELVKNLFEMVTVDTQIAVASRDFETPVYRISKTSIQEFVLEKQFSLF
ncbi:beta-lactamase domain protein [Pseudopedobacter saltans DSM 12145]|uniref:Beta-lactamase domain protein n=1 Tax=Pseudopedobacter saltans (strain ATCC 51119 / DSM 12145 / JCM 21818 / CCUG 39354 / LMG 10337 / NBRC 100064 / NCIMB 13643) TaxID=762903 RepID=F0S775_PSESL|nr:MBL fold metallo-hydrolase [Pseudopedobacter saltans]ADY54348.1 beta-lactamase domain protein [Pseudopedobacter saltans DSM 12145]